MNALLRQYTGVEIGPDGYPFAWHCRHWRAEAGYQTYDGEDGVTITHDESGDGDDGAMRPAIKDYIRELAGHRCLRCGHPYPAGIAKEHWRGEWTPCDEHCDHSGPFRWADVEDGWHYDREWILPKKAMRDPDIVIYAQWRILTVHHLDEDKANCRWWNLAALCQRCHLRMQRAVVIGRPYHFEHTTWFRPFAAGFYAWKYLEEDLSRDATMARLDELLALEHRFTQEVLL